EPAERRPALESVVDRLADLGLARCAITLGTQPALEFGEDWRRLFSAPGQARLGALAIDRTLDGEQAVDPGHGLGRDRGLGHLCQLEELAPGMGPTGHLEDRPGFTMRGMEAIEPGIGIGLHQACERG